MAGRCGEPHAISTASFRLSTPYGPMERVTSHRAVMSVFHDWTGRAMRGESITAGTWVTLQQILDQVTELLPSTKIVTPAGYQETSGSEGYSRGPLSGRRLFDDLGWTPRYGLKDGLADYIKSRREANFLD